MDIKTIGLDLGKREVHVAAVDAAGRVVLRRKLSREKLGQWLANLPSCRIGMEASCGAHHLARRLGALGHEVRLMPAQYVRPYVKTNKHDVADAEAVAEAVQRPTMRFVPVKSEAQLDLQALHRVRDGLVGKRTAVINQIRAFLLERGIAVAQGPRALVRALPELLAADGPLSPMMCGLLHRLRAHWQALDRDIETLDAHLLVIAKSHPTARLLTSIPGIGPLIATAILAAIDNGAAFKHPRNLAAWLGLVPRQHSTGGRTTLLGISRRGNAYLRRLLVHAARSLKRIALTRNDGLGRWLRGLSSRAHRNVVTVALAAKLARWVHAVLLKKEPYCAVA